MTSRWRKFYSPDSVRVQRDLYTVRLHGENFRCIIYHAVSRDWNNDYRSQNLYVRGSWTFVALLFLILKLKFVLGSKPTSSKSTLHISLFPSETDISFLKGTSEMEISIFRNIYFQNRDIYISGNRYSVRFLEIDVSFSDILIFLLLIVTKR